MVVIVVIPSIIDHQHKSLAALRPFYINVNGMTVGGICHGLRLIKSLGSNHPSVVVALEECQIPVVRGRIFRCPCHLTTVLIAHHLMGILSVCVHVEVFVIGEKRERERVILRHLTTEEER